MKTGFETKGGGDSFAGKSGFVPPTVAEIAKLFPQLEIIELLGHGGMGAVYKARQPRLNRLVALKILSAERRNDPQFDERFEREARTLAFLTHPGIVTVYDFGEANGHFHLLMEFVDGMTLRQLLKIRSLSAGEALGVVQKVCEALQYAHDQGVIHRDIKPENILLDKKGQLKIADFGIAKIMDLAPEDLSLTGAKDVVGTPLYMAPEQIEKPQTVDGRADIYSVGVMFYEMLTGELPLGKFPPPSQKARIDARLDAVVLRALEKEPDQRYQHAREIKTEVEKMADNAQNPASVQSVPPAARVSWILGAGVAMLMGGIVLSVFWLKARPKAGSDLTSSRKSWSSPLLTDEKLHEGLVALWPGDGNGHDGAGTNDAALTDMTFADGVIGQAFSLNGHGSSAKISASPTLDLENRDGLTISAWIKPDDVSGFHPIVEWFSDSTPPMGIGCQLRLGWKADSHGLLVAVIVDMDGRYHVLRSLPDTVMSGRFQQVAVTYDKASGNGILYLNGQIAAQSAWKSFSPKTKGDLWISYRPAVRERDFTYHTFFAGLIDDVAIYNRALTGGEINEYYQAVLKEAHIMPHGPAIAQTN